MPTSSAPPGPRVLDALSLLSEVADELVVKSVRDTHLAFADRAHAVTRRATGGASAVPEMLHRGIAAAVYEGLGLGLRAASRGFDKAAGSGLGPPLESTPRGRFVTSAVNGLIGDKLLAERPHMAIPMAVRRDGADVGLEADDLAEAFPDARGQVVIFLHGLCENESYWNRHRDRTGTTYGEALTDRRLDPASSCASTPASALRENGVALTALVQRLVESWPVPVTRIALVGHSLGGLVDTRGGRGRRRPRRPRLERPGHRRRHPRHPAPRCADRLGHRPRQPRPAGAARDRRLRADPRLALDRRARPRRRPRRGRAAAAARALPAGVAPR